jgi:hypothetical protein
MRIQSETPEWIFGETVEIWKLSQIDQRFALPCFKCKHGRPKYQVRNGKPMLIHCSHIRESLDLDCLPKASCDYFAESKGYKDSLNRFEPEEYKRWRIEQQDPAYLTPIITISKHLIERVLGAEYAETDSV